MPALRVLQEKPQGEFATLWKTSLEEDTGLEQVELNAALADIMASKDATEQVTAVLVRVSPSPNHHPNHHPHLHSDPSPNPRPNPSPNPRPHPNRRAPARRVLRLARTHTRPETLAPCLPLTLALTLNPNLTPLLQACVKRAAIFSAVVMQKHVVQKLEGVVDEAPPHAEESVCHREPATAEAAVPGRGRGWRSPPRSPHDDSAQRRPRAEARGRGLSSA